jgi:transposase, IS5 family
MFTSHIHQRKLKGKPLPEHTARANTKRSKVRSAVEHVFAGQKHRMGLIVRTIGIARARIKIGMANLAYNFQRLVWLEGQTAPA